MFPKQVAPAEYRIVISNWNDVKIRSITSIPALRLTIGINSIGSYSLDLPRNFSVDSIPLDALIRVYRRVRVQIPAYSIPYLPDTDWYILFAGLHRKSGIARSSGGSYREQSMGKDLKHFLSRTQIAYVGGTVQAAKSGPVETVMKEYVNENCGPLATVANGRKRSGVLPRFSVGADLGRGVTWSGDKTGENLFDTLTGIAGFSDVDFDVFLDGSNFVFDVRPSQYGKDRTTIGLNPVTGKNAAGNSPVIFSISRNLIAESEYVNDRESEVNVAYVLGDGDGATRTWVTRTSSDVNGSPWNRCEVSRPQGGFTYEMEDAGDEILREGAKKEEFSAKILQRNDCYFGAHYTVGDRCTCVEGSHTMHKRLIQASLDLSPSAEDWTFTFADYKR